MYYVYFIFAGYRVAIGKTTNLVKRISNYQRTHYLTEVLGLIECETQDELISTEKQVIDYFEPDKAFRDMFYLSPNMLSFLTKNTVSLSPDRLEQNKEVQRTYQRTYQQERRKDPEFREYKREYNRKYKKERYQNDPEFRERTKKQRSNRYKNYPEFRQQNAKRTAKSRAKNRKKRPVSPQTLDLF